MRSSTSSVSRTLPSVRRSVKRRSSSPRTTASADLRRKTEGTGTIPSRRNSSSQFPLRLLPRRCRVFRYHYCHQSVSVLIYLYARDPSSRVHVLSPPRFYECHCTRRRDSPHPIPLSYQSVSKLQASSTDPDQPSTQPAHLYSFPRLYSFRCSSESTGSVPNRAHRQCSQ